MYWRLSCLAPHLLEFAGLFIAKMAQEASMAKGQKRSNRETRKPKTDKQPAPVAATSLLTKGILTPFAARPPRKK